ncbi:hypothetical protein SCUCBS95973_009259 [Sporothrix curviconia]|uniref:Beta-lactamase/transpeptidase-like protein n=1 Tax=Sporothrix curviconia TaxID=1260050 RepID=A0ABP0CTD4_9PEZI
MQEPATASMDMRHRVAEVVPQIAALRQIGGTVGLSVGVVSHGSTILDHHLGFADTSGAVANASTRYTLGSLTKAFVSATVAQLVDEDALRGWDAGADGDGSVGSYLPALTFEDRPSLAQQLSLTDLLTHRTGLGRLDALWLGASGRTLVPKSATVALCGHLPSVAPVRSTWLYNNWMYALVAEVMERATGQHWGETLAARVLQPLHLTQTTVIASEIPDTNIAMPYMVLDDKTPSPLGHQLGLTQDEAMAAAGGVRSSLHDLLVWSDSLLASLAKDEDGNENKNENKLTGLGPLFSGHSFLNSSVANDELYGFGFAKVTTPVTLGKIGFNPGLVPDMPVLGAGGKHTRSRTVFYHSGGLPGYNHCLILVPHAQTAIVVLTNSIAQGDVADWTAQALLQAVLGDGNGGPAEQPVDFLPYAERAAAAWRSTHQKLVDELDKGRQPGTPEPAHADLVGRYEHVTKALFLEVSQTDDTLKFRVNDAPEQEHVLTHYAGNTFIFLPATSDERLRRGLFHYGASAWLVEFRKDDRGRFTEIAWNLDNDTPAPEKFERVEEPRSKL